MGQGQKIRLTWKIRGTSLSERKKGKRKPRRQRHFKVNKRRIKTFHYATNKY